MQLDKSKFARIRCEMYKIMPEPKDFLKSNDPCAAQKKVEGMKALSQFMHCFRSSQSLLWPLKWNRRLLFVIMTYCSTACPFIENNLFKNNGKVRQVQVINNYWMSRFMIMYLWQVIDLSQRPFVIQLAPDIVSSTVIILRE